MQQARWLPLAIAAALVASLSAGYATPIRAQPGRTAGTVPLIARLHAGLAFIPNHGQMPRAVRFAATWAGGTILLTRTGAVLQEVPAPRTHRLWRFSKPIAAPSGGVRSVRLEFAGALGAVTIAAEDRLPGRANFFIGRNPTKWQVDLPTYGRVMYRGLYPGIDLLFRGSASGLEYDWIVHPGANLNRIRLAVRGGTPIFQRSTGSLVIDGPAGRMIQHAPLAFQYIGRHRHVLLSRYILTASHQIGVSMRNADPSKTLVIDPVLSYSSYLGGSGLDEGTAITTDTTGNAYVTGIATSTDFPAQTTLGTSADSHDAFVTKLSPDGRTILYSTFIGGDGQEDAEGIAVDTAGDVYLGGGTSSDNFPVVNAAQQSYGGGTCDQGSAVASCDDGFIAELSPGGDHLKYSTYLGGSGEDLVFGLALDAQRDVYVTGGTDSPDFPTRNATQSQHACNTPAQQQEQPDDPNIHQVPCANIFVSKLSPSGALLYSTYYGGTGSDLPFNIAVDNAGDAIVAGISPSSDFPLVHPLQAQLNGPFNAFVLKLDPSGKPVFATFLGGSDYAGADGVGTDAGGNIYVAGETSDPDFPTVHPLQATLAGQFDAFVSKISADGSALLYSTYLGGTSLESVGDLAVDPSGNAVVVGGTDSPDFPVRQPVQPRYHPGTCGAPNGSAVPCDDAFVTVLNPAGTGLLFSTYLGGSSDDDAWGVSITPHGDVFVTGQTSSADFATMSAAQSTYAGGESAVFVARIAGVAPPLPTPTATAKPTAVPRATAIPRTTPVKRVHRSKHRLKTCPKGRKGKKCRTKPLRDFG